MTNKQLIFSMIVACALLALGAAAHRDGSAGLGMIALGAVLMGLSVATKIRRPSTIAGLLPFSPSRSPQKS